MYISFFFYFFSFYLYAERLLNILLCLHHGNKDSESLLFVCDCLYFRCKCECAGCWSSYSIADCISGRSPGLCRPPPGQRCWPKHSLQPRLVPARHSCCCTVRPLGVQTLTISTVMAWLPHIVLINTVDNSADIHPLILLWIFTYLTVVHPVFSGGW